MMMMTVKNDDAAVTYNAFPHDTIESRRLNDWRILLIALAIIYIDR